MLNELVIHNFKCFSCQRISLRQLTLLSGLNGMGKSTVLQSLLLLRQSHLQRFLETTGLALNGDLVRIGTAKDALFEGSATETIVFELTSDSGATAKWEFAYEAERDVMPLSPNSAGIKRNILSESLFHSRFQYLQAERIGPRLAFPISDHEVLTLHSVGKGGEYAAHYLEKLGGKPIGAPSMAHPATNSIRLRDQVEAWISEVCPGTRIHTKSDYSLEAAILEYSFVAGSDVTQRYRSTNVGFGLTYVLPILVAVLGAAPGDMIIIENPEAHLHPKGQLQIGRLLALAANAGIQVLVETHSDHVLNGIRLAVRKKDIEPARVKIHYFERETSGGLSSQVCEPEIDADGRLSIWPEGFFDEFDKALSALIEP